MSTSTAPANAKSTTEDCSPMPEKIWTPGVIIVVLIGIFTFIKAFMSASEYIGSKDTWIDIQPKITRILFYIMLGTICFTVAMLLFLTKFPDKAVYICIIMACIAIGLSYCALAIAAIAK